MSVTPETRRWEALVELACFPDGRGADTVRLSFSLVEEAQIDDDIERLASLVMP